MKKILLFVLVFFWAVAGRTQEVKPDLALGESGKFFMESYRSFTWYHAAKHLRPVAGGKIAVPVELFLPSLNDKQVPAMVIVHGTGGLQDNAFDMAKRLNGMGIAALVFDSFSPRGVVNVAKEQNKVTSMNMVADAYATLNILATHPKIKADKIGIVGFSKGGSVAYYTIHEKIRNVLANGENRFAMHVGFYPGCTNTFENISGTGAPLLMLLGGADNWTGAAPCQEVAERFKQHGVDVSTIVYEGTHHAWDTNDPLRSTYWDVSYINCKLEHRDNGAVFDMTTGINLDSADKAIKSMQSCGMNRGVTYGRDAESHRRSIGDLTNWVNRYLLN